jgi:outer membrane protein assembly factor BamB
MSRILLRGGGEVKVRFPRPSITLPYAGRILEGVIGRPRLPRASLLLAAAVSAAGVAACGGSSSDGAVAAPKAGAAPATGQAARSGPRDWPRFGFNAASYNRAPRGLSAAQVGKLRERRVKIDGTVDSSPIYASRVKVRGKAHDLLVMTTTYGRTLGLDAATGAVLWRYTPAAYNKVKGSAQITNATPVLDPSRRYVFAASSDGRIHKLKIGSGREVTAGPWPAVITRNPSHEKITSSLNIDGKHVLATMGGYIGDAPPYQGKVVAINRSNGRITGVFNSLCANRRTIIQPSSCKSQESAIWGRAGAVVDPSTHKIYATSSNGPYDGSTDFADTVLELSPGVGKLLRAYTPTNQKQLEDTDADLGSTSPALLPAPGKSSRTRFLLQGGKDRKLRLLSLGSSLRKPNGRPQLGGEVQTLPVPGDTQMFTAPAVLHTSKTTMAFVATGNGTAAYRLSGGKLTKAWSNESGGTSPVIAGGLVWIYDPSGGLNVYRPASGKRVRHLPAPSGHWNSPIVAGGRVYLPSGNANDHALGGTLSIYRP